MIASGFTIDPPILAGRELNVSGRVRSSDDVVAVTFLSEKADAPG
jgi:hypothetical protein